MGLCVFPAAIRRVVRVRESPANHGIRGDRSALRNPPQRPLRPAACRCGPLWRFPTPKPRLRIPPCRATTAAILLSLKVSTDQGQPRAACGYRLAPATSLPTFQFVRWKWLKKLGADFELTFENPQLPFVRVLLDRDQTYDRFLAAGDQHFFSPLSACDQPGELCLSLMNCADSHRITPIS